MKRNELKKDFRSLSQFLSDWGRNVKNPGLLSNIAVTQGKNALLNYGILETNPLTFINIDLDRHCLPMGIEKINKKDITLEVKLTSFCKEANTDDESSDPIESLGINIAINSMHLIGDEIKEASCSWHLDKGETGTALFSHPIYHMNFGGNHMQKQGDVFGNLLLLPAPRIIHPPLDIILSCDFIIRNFYSIRNHKSITENPGYKELLKRAKKRYWLPYSKAFASKWDEDLTINNLTHSSITGC
jgi:hypothetical protein